MQVGLNSNVHGSRLYHAIVGALNYQPPTEWFGLAIKSDLTVSTPGVWEWANGAAFGRAHIAEDKTINVAHLHLDIAHESGTMDLEIWRNRGWTSGLGSGPGLMERIATMSVPGGEANGSTFEFDFLDESDRDVVAGDYLHMQATSKPGGAGWLGYIDIHFSEVST